MSKPKVGIATDDIVIKWQRKSTYKQSQPLFSSGWLCLYGAGYGLEIYAIKNVW